MKTTTTIESRIHGDTGVRIPRRTIRDESGRRGCDEILWGAATETDRWAARPPSSSRASATGAGSSSMPTTIGTGWGCTCR